MFHQGACSDTMETDGRYMMENNYEYSKRLLEWCQEEEVPLVYASSASVYGAGPEFREERRCEAPLNVYGYSKFLFDQYVRRRLKLKERRAGRGLALLQRLRAQRGAQGAHGVGRLPCLSPAPSRAGA